MHVEFDSPYQRFRLSELWFHKNQDHSNRRYQQTTYGCGRSLNDIRRRPHCYIAMCIYMHVWFMCALIPSQYFWHTHRTVNSFWQVPSQFLLTDAMLKLDEKFNGYLLVCTETETKQDLGGKESRRVKKLLGALRHLFRNSTFSKTSKARNHVQFHFFPDLKFSYY